MENVIHKTIFDELSHESINVLEIWHPEKPDEVQYFETGDFRPAEGNIQHHHLNRCKNITHIINQHKSVYINAPDVIKTIVTAISDLNTPNVQKKFHHSFVFVWHI